MKLEDTSSEAAYEELVSRKWLFAWRFYLTIHLLFVVAMAVVTTSGHADFFDWGTWRDVAIPLVPVLYPVALFGFPMMYVSPVIIVILLGQARGRGSRYAVAALVEFLLMLAHFYAVLPAIQ